MQLLQEELIFVSSKNQHRDRRAADVRTMANAGAGIAWPGVELI